jgi:dUTP diphosphatase
VTDPISLGVARRSASGEHPGPGLAVGVRLLHAQARLPAYAKSGDAGADLHAVAEITLDPGERALVPTGIALAIPPGWVGLVHPRSGLAARHGISMVNAPGTIDSGYRGEILVNLVNLDPREPFTIHPGDRIAQLLLQEVATVAFFATESLPDSERGDTGHGSSGGFGHPAPPTTAASMSKETQ